MILCRVISRQAMASPKIPWPALLNVHSHRALTPYWAERLGKTHLCARQVSECGGEFWYEIAEPRVITKGSAMLTWQGSLQVLHHSSGIASGHRTSPLLLKNSCTTSVASRCRPSTA